MDPTLPKPDPLPKPESSKPEETNNCTNFEPFTFEIQPDPSIQSDPLVKTGPDKDCSSSSSSSSCHSSELENEDDFIQLESIINRNLINENNENENIDSDSDTDDDDFLFTVAEMSRSPNNVNINRTNNNNNTNNNDINNNNIIINNNINVTNTNEQVLRPAESPPIQTMTRSDPVEPNRVEPDPNRIPASIFAPKANISEWSVTSNESLFSIKIGNNINNNTSRSPVPGSPAGPVPVREELSVPVVIAGSVISEVDSSVLSGINMSGRYSDISVSQRSDGSMSSLQSFAFPILSAQERAKSVQDQTQVQPAPSEPKPESNLPSSSNETDKGNISGNNGNNNISGNNVDDGGNKTGGVFSCFPCCS